MTTRFKVFCSFVFASFFIPFKSSAVDVEEVKSWLKANQTADFQFIFETAIALGDCLIIDVRERTG